MKQKTLIEKTERALEMLKQGVIQVKDDNDEWVKADVDAHLVGFMINYPTQYRVKPPKRALKAKDLKLWMMLKHKTSDWTPVITSIETDPDTNITSVSVSGESMLMSTVLLNFTKL